MRIIVFISCLGLGLGFSLIPACSAERPHRQRPTARQHNIIQSDGVVQYNEAKTPPIADNKFTAEIVGQYRVLTANGVAIHLTGRFPNQNNPNAISPQDYTLRVPARPSLSGSTSPMRGIFGIALNGVPFDPGADEWYLGKRGGKWQYEPLSGAIPLGLDQARAHVQPTGAYHYHGIPRLFLQRLGASVASNRHSPLIGWAADGFPIYYLYGYKDGDDKSSGIQQQRSSYRLRSGRRPSGGDNPGGVYDGTFTADYEYVAGSGTLDECNGRITVSPEATKPRYAYFLTEEWPVIPRCYKGSPSADFQKDSSPRR